MEKFCTNCGRVFDDLNYKICPFCQYKLDTRYGRQPIPRKLRHEVFKRDGYRCRECGASKDETSLEIDHILPVAKGGTNDIDNLQTLCRECNRMKHTDEWVGGEDNIKIATNELNNLKRQLIDAESKLKQVTNDEDIIEYKFKIKKLTEDYIPNAQDKIDKLLHESEIESAKIRLQQEKIEEKNMLFKKLYVQLDDNLILKLVNHFKLSGSSNEENLRLLVDGHSENEIYNAIEFIKKESSKKSLYNKLSNNLSKYDISLLSKECAISNDKASVINYFIDNFTEQEINEKLMKLHRQDKEKTFNKNLRKVENRFNVNDNKHDEILKELRN